MGKGDAGVNLAHSFTSARAFPAKLLRRSVTTEDGRIYPYHVQIYPTNRCNLRCSFCSCHDRPNVALPESELVAIAELLPRIGTRSVTISGGGEPLLHPSLGMFVGLLCGAGIKVGMATNGTLLGNSETGGFTWVRISRGDGMVTDASFIDGVGRAVRFYSETDWAFSYVLTDKPDWDHLLRVLDLAKQWEFSHVRIVSDLVALGGVPEMETVRAHLAQCVGIFPRIIFQNRKTFTRGRTPCLLSLLKPVILADGGLAPCCGAQYAIDGEARDVPAEMRMGVWRDLERIYRDQDSFPGAKCDRCYYEQYNEALTTITTPLQHEEFV